MNKRVAKTVFIAVLFSVALSIFCFFMEENNTIAVNDTVITNAHIPFEVNQQTASTKNVSSAMNSKLLEVDPILCEEGKDYTHMIESGGSLVFEYNYTKTEVQCEFVMRINRFDSADMRVKVYYYDASDSIQYVDCSRMEYDMYFTFILEKSVGKYYIEIQSAIHTSLQFRMYVPTVIEDIFIDNYNIRDYINSLYLGIGCTHEFRIVCNSTATYGVTMRLGQPLDGVSISGSKVTVSNITTLADKSVDIYFESVQSSDGKRYTVKTHTFFIKQPYKASCNIYDNKFNVEFKGLYGATVNDVYSAINYFYYFGGVRYDLIGNGDTVDIIHLPNVNAVSVFANIQYKNGYSETIDCLFEEIVYSLDDEINTNGKKRLLIDAMQNHGNIFKKIIVPKNIVTLNIRGGFSLNGVNIFITNDRTSPLYINFDTCDYSSSMAPALYYGGEQHVYLGIYGNCGIETSQEYAHGIDIPNLTISGGNLFVKGGRATIGTSWTTGGNGIQSTDLTLVDCKLYVSGGDGYLYYRSKNTGMAGMHGGNGIVTNSLTVKNSSIIAYGGDGGNGSDGISAKSGASGDKGGAGGNGGYGICAQNIDAVSSSFELYGGNGGNGGKGGDNVPAAPGLSGKDGGAGGNGGNGLCVQNIDAVSSSFELHGGNGGNGGNGSNGTNGSIGYDGVLIKTGGAGGIGGDGGNGGYGIYVQKISAVEPSFKLYGGNGGNGGIGGNGGDEVVDLDGNAGNGGKHGEGEKGSNVVIDGAEMSKGQIGIEGDKGKGGAKTESALPPSPVPYTKEERAHSVRQVTAIILIVSIVFYAAFLCRRKRSDPPDENGD